MFRTTEFSVVPDKEVGEIHNIQTMGSCTKKSLQVWLHEELDKGINGPKNNSIYNKFRAFRSIKNNNFIQNIQSGSYKHPLATKGALLLKGVNSLNLSPANQLFRFFANSVNFLFTPNIPNILTSVSRNNLATIKNYSEIVCNKRNEKITLIPKNIFSSNSLENTSSVLIINKIANAETLKVEVDALPNDLKIDLDLNGEQDPAALEDFVIQFGDRITSLNLGKMSYKISNNLLKKIILACSNLITIDLEGSEKFEELPKELGSLANLQTLNLSQCVGLKELPKEIGNLANLATLNLSQCVGLKELPKEIGNLTNLATLILKECRLIELPKEIGNLVNLTTLILFQCRIIELPKEIGNLISLTELDLYNCFKLNTLPDELGKLINLKKFNIKDCSFRELPQGLIDLEASGKLKVLQ